MARLVDQAVKATVAAMPTPQPRALEVEKIVQQTVIVERPIEVTVVVEREVVATPTLRPSPTPAPTVDVPSDWVEYEDITDVFTVRHPADWLVTNEFVNTVAFRVSTPDAGGARYWSAGVGFANTPQWPLVGEADQEAINQLVREARETVSSGYKFELIAKGVWRNKGYFVEYRGSSIELWVVLPVANSGAKIGQVSAGLSLSDEARDTLDLVLSSMVLSP